MYQRFHDLDIWLFVRNRESSPTLNSLSEHTRGEEHELRGTAAPSPAGPLSVENAHALPEPPTIMQPPVLQTFSYYVRMVEFMFRARRELGEVFRARLTKPMPDRVVTSHPDHVRSLLTAGPDQVIPDGSPELRPIIGPNSILNMVGSLHTQRRKLLLPSFHGQAVSRLVCLMAEITEREIDRWPIDKPIPLVPRMRSITLDVILAAIFGPRRIPVGSPEYRLRFLTRSLLAVSNSLPMKLSGLLNLRQSEATGLLRAAVELINQPLYESIRRRRLGESPTHEDILSLLLNAKDETGRPLSDEEVRDEVVTLILAGHETTANTLGWVWERLVHNQPAYEALRIAVRAGGGAEMVEAVVIEGMRSRPVLGGASRQLLVPWRLGRYRVPAGTLVEMNSFLIHHRDDTYPRPFEFRPERWLGQKPRRYEWVAFGGGTRRCLGAAFAMTQQKVVVELMSRRLHLEAAEPVPERAAQRHTIMPAHGARVVLRSRLD
jgi:cytochrome P450